MVGWGVSYVPSAWMVQRWPPLSSASLRLACGGLVVLGMCGLMGRPMRPRIGVSALIAVALTQSALFYGAVFWGIAHAGAGLSAVLANTDPLFVAILAAAVLGERLSPRQWWGVGVGLVGVMVVVWEGAVWPPTVTIDGLVVLLGALGWGVGTVIVARGVRGRADPRALAGWQMIIGAVILAPMAAAEEPAVPTITVVGLAIGLAVIGGAIPLALFYRALAEAPAGEVSVWFFLVPVIGVASAWPLLGEVPDASLAAGMGAVAVALWLVLGRRVA